MQKRHLFGLLVVFPHPVYLYLFPSDEEQDQLGFLHSTRSSSEKSLAIVKSKEIREMTERRTRKKLKVDIFILKKGKEGGMMMTRQYLQVQKRLCLERGSMTVLPSSQGSAKGSQGLS